MQWGVDVGVKWCMWMKWCGGGGLFHLLAKLAGLLILFIYLFSLPFGQSRISVERNTGGKNNWKR